MYLFNTSENIKELCKIIREIIKITSDVWQMTTFLNVYYINILM